MVTPNFLFGYCSNKKHSQKSVLADITVEKPNFLGASRDAQNVCVVAKAVGTVLKDLEVSEHSLRARFTG